MRNYPIGIRYRIIETQIIIIEIYHTSKDPLKLG